MFILFLSIVLSVWLTIYIFFLQKIYKIFCNAKNVQKKIFFCLKFLQNSKFETYTLILDHVKSL